LRFTLLLAGELSVRFAFDVFLPLLLHDARNIANITMMFRPPFRLCR
jgi:hypothetical protein